jgi:predicted SAM-dependent methyltransferase
MARTFLHVGCGKRLLPNFVNIDIGPEAEVRVDVRGGLPYSDESVDGVFSEHFLEHLTVEEGTRFLRECRRVLRPGGRVRVATPDLDAVVQKYNSDWQNQDWMRTFGYDWLPNRCYMLNVTMREWEHRWVYNEEELRRVGLAAGFADMRRCALGVSDEPALAGLEYRTDSVVVEFTRPAEPELVSILIPAYHARFFPAALESALRQTYRETEIVIGDDCPTDEIGNHVASLAPDPRVRYFRHHDRVGARRNYLSCFEQARGPFVKFLNDDDLLAPNCVERMAVIMRAFPWVSLVTSHRQPIDEGGRPLADSVYTRPVVPRDMILDGSSAVGVMLATTINFIGEPTTTLFRKQEAEAEPDFMSFGGHAVTWNVDMSIWARLLSRGHLCFLAERLSAFRQHAAQEQRQPGAIPRAEEAIRDLRERWTAAGGTIPSESTVRRVMVLA